MLKAALARALLVSAGLALALVLAEALLSVGHRALRGEPFPHERYRKSMIERSAASPAGGGTKAGEWGQMVLHPYLGFVPDPAGMRDRTTIGDPGQILPRSDETLVVGIFGGSFAAGLCAFGGTELSRGLARPGKEVRIVCAAAAGYKQPQQLLALAYLLVQGAHFDLAINVDGFNEIALPPLDNLPQGVAPIYPRAWFWLIGNVHDPAALTLLGSLATVGRQRSAWAGSFLGWRLERSAIFALLWDWRDQRLAAEREAILTRLLEHKVARKGTYAATGPAMRLPDDAALHDYDARVWGDASRQMQRLCAVNGIEYRHFLQPNQHVPGSKPLAAEELRLTSRPSPYRDMVLSGYPLLRARGRELGAAGVRFADLTSLFEDVREPLYSDGCCHLKPRGYVLVAQAIAESIRGGAGNSP